MPLHDDTILALIEAPCETRGGRDGAVHGSPLARSLATTGLPVMTFVDPSACIGALPDGASVVFVVDHDAARRNELLWLILLAESRLGPVVLVSDEESRRETLERAGVDAMIPRASLEAGGALLPAYLEAVTQQARATRSSRAAEARVEVLEDAARAERKQAAEFRREAEQYVRDSLHEFRTPLTSMHEFAAILHDGLGGPLTDKQQEYLEYVLRGTKDMLELFDDFRDAIRLRLDDLPTMLGEHEVTQIVQAALSEAETDRVHYEVEMPHKGGPLFADAGQMRKSLARVLSWAAKATPRGGKVRLCVRPVADEAFEFSVIDGGPTPTEGDGVLLRDGVVQSSLQRKSVTKVFGIGIELARALLLLNGGRLELSAAEETGSILSFRVPKRKSAQAASSRSRAMA